MSEFNALMQFVSQNCSSLSNQANKTVKYVDPVFDMRTGLCFSITFREYGGKATNFNCSNENREIKDSLYNVCVNWLTNKT